MQPVRAIPPGAWLGLLGGGQLGRMFCMAAQSLGYKVVVLDPGARQPGRQRRRPPPRRRLPRSAARSAELAALAAAATTEFENVPAAALDFLARTARVTPAAASVAIAQDRISEKTFLSGHGFAVAPFAVLRSDDDARDVDRGAAARHRQERALRLRRQGPGARAHARRGASRRGAR